MLHASAFMGKAQDRPGPQDFNKIGTLREQLARAQGGARLYPRPAVDRLLATCRHHRSEILLSLGLEGFSR
jgi:hypothetical protein